MNLSLPENLNVEITPHAQLSEYTTFRLGGPCRALISCQSPYQLEEVVKYLSKEKLPFILIGEGSNLLVSDGGVDCFVVRYLAQAPLIERDVTSVIVTGSTKFDDLARFATQDELEGLSFASGIPGTVGGAIVGNAGAFGKQVSDCLKSVILLSKDGNRREVQAKELNFQYRHSQLKETCEIVLSATFALTPGSREALLEERSKILALRQEKHPDYTKQPTAGSFFKNIEDPTKGDKRQAAGWFLEQAGAKLFKCGGASVFEKHANILIKSKEICKAQDVYDLAQEMSSVVKGKFNVELNREVRFIGKFAKGEDVGTSLVW